MLFLIVIYIMQIQCRVKANIHYIAYSYYRRKSSKLLVLNVEMLIQTLFSIGMKYSNHMTKSLLKIAFLSVNLLFDLLSIFNHCFTFSSDSRTKTSCSSRGFLKVNIANTKRYGGKALISSVVSSWNDIQYIFHLIKCYAMFPLLN